MNRIRKPIYALAIVAHPDDESYLLSGISLKLCEEDKPVGIICATRGEKGGSKLTKPLTPKALGEMREKELRSACKILKTAFVEFLNYKDGGLIKADFKKLTQHLLKIIKDCQPRIVITFGKEGVTGHRDHITIGKAATVAAKKVPNVEQIWHMSMPKSIIKQFYAFNRKSRANHGHYQPHKLQGVPDGKLEKIKITPYKKYKLAALYCHKSQGEPAWIRHKDALMQKAFMNYEYYEVIKLR